MRLIAVGLIGLGMSLGALIFGGSISSATPPSKGLLPDLQTVVPKQLQIQNDQQREFLRFTNGIANLGEGDLRLRPDPFPDEAPPETTETQAFQEILDADGNPASEKLVSVFEFHPQHNHWHLEKVALFEVHKAKDDGLGGNWGKVISNDRGEADSIKTSFCLIDSYKLDDNSPTSERVYWDCEVSYQGIQPLWVDQYHQSLEGQEIDVTGAPPGVYYLVSTANPEGNFIESNKSNNSAWVSFKLTRDSNGNPKIAEIGHSPCGSPGMCGAQATNR